MKKSYRLILSRVGEKRNNNDMKRNEKVIGMAMFSLT